MSSGPGATAPPASTPPAAASWSTHPFSRSPSLAVGSRPGPPASSSQLNREWWERGRDGQQDAQILAQRDRNRASLLALDRKRRLMATGEDAIRRPSDSGAPDIGSSTHININSNVNSDRGHSYNSSTIDIHRPLPSLPSGDSSSDAPGASAATAIDLLSSSPVQPISPRRPSQDPPPPPPLPPLPLPPQRQGDLMEYILPRWQPDTEVTHCPICHTQFNFWYRKHHCRKCGRVVCAACSPHRITIPRQYIVRPPPCPTGGPASMATPPRAGGSQVIDLTNDEPSSPSASYRLGDTAPNPALGGGEEVRLCNPCVPDPNPDPPLGYRAIRSGLDHLGRDWSSATTLPGQSLHRAHHSASGGPGYGFGPDWERRRRDQNMLLPNEGAVRPLGPSNEPLPSYGSRYSIRPHSPHPPHSPPAYSSPRHFSGPSSSSFFSGSSGAMFRDGVAGSSTTRTARVHSMTEPEGPRPFDRPPHPPVRERDLCPICSQVLPPRTTDGDETEREAHIRACIEQHGRRGQSPARGGTSSSRASHALRMLPFTATEKDCVVEDGGAQECTICMEEYEVGDQLVRLECLCKFHQTCIVEWFERKRECPVHKLR